MLVFAAVAYAANVYEVTPAGTTPGGAGTAAKPKPKTVKFGFKAQDESGSRATPIKKYSIEFQGLRSFARSFPKCTFAQADSDANNRQACRRALVGTGFINNQAGPTSDPNNNTPCGVRIRLYNLGTGLAIRLDGGAAANPPTSCPIGVSQAINARFRAIRIGGRPSTALRFTTPDNILHPVQGLDNSVAEVTSSVSKKTRRVRIKGNRRNVSILSSVACARGQRTIQVVFTDENGDAVTSRRQVKC